MISYFEERLRRNGCLYCVRSWYLLGILVCRRWEQLTTHFPLPSDRE